MFKLLERAAAVAFRRMVLLAPPERAIPDAFSTCEFDLCQHSHYLRQIQRARGAIYLHDGAIREEDLINGEHRTPEDDHVWHLFLSHATGRVTACAWYREHRPSVRFSHLRLRHSPLASEPEWRDRLWNAVTDDIGRAQRLGMHYAEVGGWAVSPEDRRTAKPLILALATYALARVCGGALSVTTATTRHDSCDILARIGGRPLEHEGVQFPQYYDPRYSCVMQILRFDSGSPEPRFEPIVQLLQAKLADVRVVARPYWPMMRDHRSRSMPALYNVVSEDADVSMTSLSA